MEEYNSVLLDGIATCDPTTRGMSEKGESIARFAIRIKVNTIAGDYCDTVPVTVPVTVIAANLVKKCMDLLKENTKVRIVGRLAVAEMDWCVIADHIEIKNLQL